MSIARYLLIMVFATAVSWAAWLLILFNVDPFEAGMAGRVLFLGALFFALFGTFSVLGFLTRIMFRKHTPIFWQVMVSFRQALLLGLLAVAGLIMQALRALNLWNSMVLILFAIMVELFFLTRAAHRLEEEN